jgi:uncharacterized membrane protein YsdA (DUF1294 family)
MSPRSKSHGSSRGASQLTFFLVAGGLGLVSYYLLSQMVAWKPLYLWLAAWSFVGFGFYGWDKSQSQRGAWRVPENVLHALALAGGVLGCWVGMFLFRHKTQKSEFKLVLIVATLIWGFVLLNALTA